MKKPTIYTSTTKTNKMIMISHIDTQRFSIPGIKGITTFVMLLGLLMATTWQNAHAYQDSDTSLTKLAQGLIVDRSEEVMHVSMEIEDMPLFEALKALTEKVGVGLSYSSDITFDQKVTIQLNNVPIHEAIYTLLVGTNLEPVLPPTKDVLVIREKKDGKYMETIQRTVSGQVTDVATGEVLPGVNVAIDGTTTGTSTDIEGEYSLEIPGPDAIINFSFIGYAMQQITVADQTVINVSMERDIGRLDEVVVTGYGRVQERATQTGAVSAISGEQIEAVPTAAVTNTLGGRIAGIQSVNPTGEPGEDGSELRIRGNATLGNNEPLVVIDGVAGRQGGLDRLNPEDIDNITVLKDASAAIYGSRAANGVIVVTTKRGQSGAPIFNFNVNQGFSQPTRVPQMADAATYMRIRNEIQGYRGLPAPHSDEEIARYENWENEDPWLVMNTDWVSEVVKDWSPETEARMSVSGGSENVRYRVSLRGLTEDGFYQESATGYNQGDVRSNLDVDLSDNFRMGLDISGRLENRKLATQSSRSIFLETLRADPFRPAFWPNGDPGPEVSTHTNPALNSSRAGGWIDRDDYYLQSNFFVDTELPFIDGLAVRGNISYDRSFRVYEEWRQQYSLFEFDNSHYLDTGEPRTIEVVEGPETPELTREHRNAEDIMFNLVVRYEMDYRDHGFALMAGTERETWRGETFGAFRRGFASSEFQQLDLGGAVDRNNWGNGFHGARQNYFSRFNYNYQQTYLFELVARLDGSYIFPQQDRYGFFPSASVGWRLAQENWFQEMTRNIFDEFTLRTSYGLTGNDAVSPYQFMASYSFQNDYMFGNGWSPTITEARTPNRNITWEDARQFDVGLQTAFFNSRVEVELDYFNYLRENILWRRDAAVPFSAGFSLPDENIGKVKSYGFDGAVTIRNDVGSRLFWDVTLTGSYADNEILFFDEPGGIPEHQRNEGKPMNTNLYYQVIGVFQDEEQIANTPSWPGAQPGDLIFKDVTGDGQITADDRVRSNRTDMPKFTGGLDLNVNYRQWNLNTFWQAGLGAVLYTKTWSGTIGNFTDSFAQNRWRPDNPSEEHPRAWERDEEYWANNLNTYFLESSDYLRLKSFQIAYNLPPGIIDRLGLQRFQIYLSGFNLLTFTGLEADDPEARFQTGQAGTYYPQRRTFNIGLSFTF